MSEHDLPGEGTVNDEPRTFQQGVEDITDLLGDPETDLSEDDQESEKEESDDEPEAEGDEPEAEGEEEEDSDPDEEDGEQEEDDDSGDYEGGRFAADNAKVKLDDGSTITVADLKRNNLFQRDYTRKTTELAQEREEFQATRERVDNAAEQLAQQRDFLLSVYQNILPAQPDPSLVDPNSPNYDPSRYMFEKDTYERRVTEMNQLRQMTAQEQQRLQAETQQERQQRLAQERQRMLEVMPDLKDPAKFDQFRGEIMQVGVEEYGLSQDELSNVDDHRYLRVLRDAIAYRKLKNKAPEARQKLEGKPKLKQRRRMDPKAKTSREAQQRSQRLAKTGDFDAGVAALMDLDL